MAKGNGSGLAGRVRFAVVGLGHIVQAAVLPAFRNVPKVELAALVSGDDEKCQALSRRYGVPAVHYDRYDELLASGEVDAVYIGLPNHLHCDYTVRAAKAGVHVLCEKPMAVTAAECEQMIAACEAADVRLMIAYRLHFERTNLEVVDRVLRGQIGEPRLFTSTFSQVVVEDDVRLVPLEKGGGTIFDLGIYCINAARYLFRDEPYEVLARSVRGSDPRFADCDEATSVTLRFPGERLASFTCSFGAADVAEYRVVGDRGSIRVDEAYRYATEMAYEVTVDGRVDRQVQPPTDQFGPELQHFADCVLGGTDPEPDGLEGLADVRIILAIHESARTGRPVQVAPPRRLRRPSLEQAITLPPVPEPDLVQTRSPSG